jgi:DNA-binding transcriptional MerR regulator
MASHRATTEPAPVADAPDHEEGFRPPQVCSVVGITYRQLDYWARTDLVRPSVSDAHGSGTQRRYSYTDLVELKVVKSLLDAGISLRAARQAIEYLREELGDDLASANLVLDGNKSVVARSGDQIVDLLRRGQGVLNIVPLGPVVDDLDARILELGDHRAARSTADDADAARTRAASGG